MARISPKVASFARRRQGARRERERSVFEQDACVIVRQLAAAPQQPDPTLPATARVAVELADQAVTDHTAAQAATRLFAAHRDLKFYLVLADRPSRVVAVSRDTAIANYTAAQQLPDDLPWSTACQPPVLADAIRRQKTRYGRLPRAADALILICPAAALAYGGSSRVNLVLSTSRSGISAFRKCFTFIFKYL